MIEQFFRVLEVVDEFYWSYIGFVLIVSAGAYFTIKSKFFQFKTIFRLKRTIRELQECADKKGQGTHPIKLYFASVGGMIGLGNMVGVITALNIGGPGALLWLWVASFSGMLIKYSEIYLGLKFRQPNQQGGFDGGPMYYLKKAFKNPAFSILAAFLLCIYGVEVNQFLIITDTLTSTFSLNRWLVIGFLLIATLYTGLGGVNRLATVCTWLMPGFMIAYVVLCLWIIGHHVHELGDVFKTIIKSAFQGHAALGGFAGSTFILAAQHGISRAVYSGDIGVGYDSIIQSESMTTHPERQARLAIYALLTDSVVCTMSMLVVLVTGVWCQAGSYQPSQFVCMALQLHIPYTEYFMAIFFFLAGFTTIIAFFTVGLKCARFLSGRYGQYLYVLYAIFAFIFFSFFDQTKVYLIMSLSGGFLVLLNLSGILRLRHHIKFN